MVNKAILLGRVGNSPEKKVMNNGGPMINFSLATSESWKDKQTGEKREKTEWHKILVFQNLAEIVEKYVNKGDLIYCEGKIQTRKWQDKTGQDRYTTEIIANEIKMLGNKNKVMVKEHIEPNPKTAGLQYKTVGALSYQDHQPCNQFEDDEIPF